MIYLMILCFSVMAWSQVDTIAQDKFSKIQSLVNNPEVEGATQQLGIGSVLMQMALGLLVIGVLFAVLIYLLKKLNIGKTKMSEGADFQVLQTFYMGSQQKIQTVKIYDKVYLLAVNSNGVQVIDENVQLPEGMKEANQDSFVQTVDKMLEKYKRGFSLSSKEKN